MRGKVGKSELTIAIIDNEKYLDHDNDQDNDHGNDHYNDHGNDHYNSDYTVITNLQWHRFWKQCKDFAKI